MMMIMMIMTMTMMMMMMMMMMRKVASCAFEKYKFGKQSRWQYRLPIIVPSSVQPQHSHLPAKKLMIVILIMITTMMMMVGMLVAMAMFVEVVMIFMTIKHPFNFGQVTRICKMFNRICADFCQRFLHCQISFLPFAICASCDLDFLYSPPSPLEGCQI